MALFVTILIDGLAQVSIFPTRWLVAATIISSRGIGCVNPSARSEALGPGAARAAVATIPISPTLLVVLARCFGLGGLGVMRRHSSYLLGAERKGIPVPAVILGRF